MVSLSRFPLDYAYREILDLSLISGTKSVEIIATMSEEKVRVSGELSRPAAPVLPTLNPDAEKVAAEKATASAVPTFVYVGYVLVHDQMRERFLT